MSWIRSIARIVHPIPENDMSNHIAAIPVEENVDKGQSENPEKSPTLENFPEPIRQGFSDHGTPNIDLQIEKVIVERILASYRKMKAAQKQADIPYQPGHKWGPEIEARRAEYVRALRSDDVLALTDLFRNFYRNSGSYALLKYIPFQDLIQASENQPQLLDDFHRYLCLDLEAWKEYAEDQNLNNLSVPLVGNPYGCIVEGQLITAASCCHNYYAQRVRSLMDQEPEPIVAEIGAGFGGMAYFLLSSGKKFHYIDFDLPEVLIMAEYFLLSALPDKSFLLYGELPGSDLSMDVLKKYDAILMPNFQMPTLPNSSVDMFINTHSLSEMDYPTVAEYVSQISRTCKRYFFHENSEMKVDIGYGNLEVTASSFPIPKDQFTRIYKLNAIWREPRYREYLYMRK